MQLIFMDQDIEYCDRLMEELLTLNNQTGMIFRITSFEELEKIELNFNEPMMILLDDRAVTQKELSDCHYKKGIPFTILCEGALSGEILQWLIEINIAQEVANNYCVNRYQSSSSIIQQIHENYIFQGDYLTIDKIQKTKLIALFTPYGESKTSQLIESYIEKYNRSGETALLIHYDPYYQAIDSDKLNLSFIFSQIKRKQRNISWMIEEISITKSTGLRSIKGPSHMLDIDYLDEESMQIFIQWLQKGTKYHRIFFNFNGVHISKHVDKILNISSKCVLLSNSEAIQYQVMRQFQYTWYVPNGDAEKLIKEMMI
jgi:hypothetical protein